ncbi:hypothetical protein C0Q70_20699 [Pomacea canaliculata]|uniref:Major facilitator superfamily (MFS) profile domain-containing protein n=1 Tax=Pomacea canaliculata TaxID=400727 RepID=A0A2T7NG97_POMCA|nr:hypothetical protein C0Q70_20699 [Pomacea canaliculata]
MKTGVEVDPLLRALGAKGRYQLTQLVLICLGSLGASYQLFANIFTGRDVPFHCAPPINSSHLTGGSDEIPWNSSSVTYDTCVIRLDTNTTGGGNHSRHHSRSYGCLYGYQYDLSLDASFMSEFDLVCGGYLLVSLAQTLVVLGQALGASVASMVSDRFGRKRVLVGSQLGLFVVGVGIGLAPTYPIFAVLKVVVGFFQQGVVTGVATMGIELFTLESRVLIVVVSNLFWAVGTTSMALFAFLLRHASWRVLQYTLSGVSLLTFLLQFWLVDESFRWLAANGKVEDALQMLRRAARINGKNIDSILDNPDRWQQLSSSSDSEGDSAHLSVTNASTEVVSSHLAKNLSGHVTTQFGQRTRPLTVLDIFRHKRLLINAFVTYYSWITVAFVFFTLYMTSTSYVGDPYLNYFLTAVMEMPSCIILYFLINRFGRKKSVQMSYAFTAVSLFASATCRPFSGIYIVGTLSAVFAMFGMLGGSAAFSGLFFYTPEYFPTNLRQQALGTSSTMGRIGGMVAPFMKNLAKTKGRELPRDIADIKLWYKEARNANIQAPKKAVSTQKDV